MGRVVAAARVRASGATLAGFALAAVAAACAVGGGDSSGADYGDSGGGVDATSDTGGDVPRYDGAAHDGTGSDVASDAGSDGDDASDDSTSDAPSDATSDQLVDAGNVAIVFVSSQLYTGSMGGLAGADTSCQTLATAANLPGTYKAWLSDGTGSAKTRLTHGTVPYALVDGTVVANDWTGLTSGTLLHGIDKTETGGAPPVGTVACTNGSLPHVWTNTNILGNEVSTAYSCTNWSSTAGTEAYMGHPGATGSQWTTWCLSIAVATCSRTAALYCVQQ